MSRAQEGDADALAFETLGGDGAEQSGGFVDGHGGNSGVVFHYYEPYLIGHKATLLDKETGDVASRYLLFFPGIEVQSGRRRVYRIGGVARRYIGTVKSHIFRNIVSLRRENIYRAPGIDTRCTPVAMGPSLLGQRHMVVNYRLYGVYVKTARTKISGYEYRGGAIIKQVDRLLPVGLVEGAVLQSYRQPSFLEVSVYTVGAFTMIDKYDDTTVVERV